MVLLKHARATFEFSFTEKLEAGMVLLGHEVKSLKGRHGSLSGAFVRLMGGEAWLVNAQIPLYPYAQDPDYDPRRMRKLLLKKREILRLTQLTQQKGWQLVPLAVIQEGRFIKLEFGLGKGREKKDKRQVIKNRELDREAAAAMKHRY